MSRCYECYGEMRSDVWWQKYCSMCGLIIEPSASLVNNTIPTHFDTKPLTNTQWHQNFGSDIGYPHERNYKFSKISKYHIRPDNNIIHNGLKDLEILSEKLNLPKHIREDAAQLFQRAVEHHVMNTSVLTEVIVIASILTITERDKLSKEIEDFEDFMEVYDIAQRDIKRTMLRLKVLELPYNDRYDLSRLSSAIKIEKYILKKAENLLRKARIPVSNIAVVAAAVYLSSVMLNIPFTIIGASQVFGVEKKKIDAELKKLISTLNKK